MTVTELNQPETAPAPQMPVKKRKTGLMIFLFVIGGLIVFFVGLSFVAKNVMTGLDLNLSGDTIFKKIQKNLGQFCPPKMAQFPHLLSL